MMMVRFWCWLATACSGEAIAPPMLAEMVGPDPRVTVTVEDAVGPNFWVKIAASLPGGPDSVFYSATQSGTAAAVHRFRASVVRDSFAVVKPAANVTVSGNGCAQTKRRGLLSNLICKTWSYKTPDEAPPDPDIDVTTDTTVAFDDAFSRAGVCAKAATVNGWGWGMVNTGVGDSVRVMPDALSPSGCALAIIYQGGLSADDGWAEPRFTVGQKPTEIFVGFVVKSPANYAHRNVSPSNNKLLRIWDMAYDNSVVHVGLSTLSSGSTAQSNLIVEWSNPSGATGNWGTGPWSRVFLPGAVDTIGFYAKVASGLNVKDGVIRVWFNRQEVYARTDVDNNTSSTAAGAYAGFGNGYLFGWANSGFAQRTEFRVYRFMLARKPVSWFVS